MGTTRSRIRGARDGAVVRALASHQCGPGSNPGVDTVCGLNLLLVLSLIREVSLRAVRFFPLLKNQRFQQFDLERTDTFQRVLMNS